MFGKKKEKAIVGLDIGSYAVKAVELGVKKKGKKNIFEVDHIGYGLIPHDAIVEGQIIDAAAVADAIKTAFDRGKIATRDVTISVSGNSVIVKKISLPAMDSDELAESIVWEAKHNIPYPYEETNVDYAILKPSNETPEAGLEILLVAVKKEKVAAYSNVVTQSRKNLLAIEVDAFALYNALEINYPDEFETKTLALVNLGANITNIVISEHGQPQILRDLSLGGAFFIENIRKDLNVGPQEAEELLKGMPSRTIEPFQIESVINLNIKGLLEEVEKTFTFFQAEDKAEKRLEHIYLSGGLSNLKGMTSAFESKFSVKTTLFDPFRSVHYDERKLEPSYYQDSAPCFALAVGLATRGKEK